MALEMKVYREVRAYEAKVMFGLSWRQLGALAVGIPLAGGLFAGIAYALHQTGQSWDDATDAAMWVIFPILIPVAAWGWWRPKGLKPERFIGYLIRYYLFRKVITYDDTYRPHPTNTEEGAGHEPVSQSGTPTQPTRSERRAARREARRRKKIIPREHPKTTRQARAQARRAARQAQREGRH